VKIYQLAAIDELLLVRCILSLYFVFYLFWAGISTWEVQESPIKTTLFGILHGIRGSNKQPPPTQFFISDTNGQNPLLITDE
jgi:hypothetical protein